MEMTGLDVDREVPIEIAAIVTDFDFRELGQYHSVISQPKSILDAMDDWNRKHHGESGLVAEVLTAGRAIEEVEQELVRLIGLHFTDPAVIAGNSIAQDRLFINKYLPKFAARLHYRMLDVTSWKILMNAKYNRVYKKKGAHRAIDDIRESIAELSHYLDLVTPYPD
jgi:oligoribonuclease